MGDKTNIFSRRTPFLRSTLFKLWKLIKGNLINGCDLLKVSSFCEGHLFFSRSELSYFTAAMITNSLHITNSTSNLLRKHHDAEGTELLTVLYTLASVLCMVCLLVVGQRYHSAFSGQPWGDVHSLHRSVFGSLCETESLARQMDFTGAVLGGWRLSTHLVATHLSFVCMRYCDPRIYNRLLINLLNNLCF